METWMKTKGFELEPSGGGAVWYTKSQEDGFWAITSDNGIDAPTWKYEPVLIGKYNNQGDEFFEAITFPEGLKIFFEHFNLI